MAKARETRGKKPGVSMTQDERIRAAMGKAIREVRRHAEANNIKLAVAGEKSWSVPEVSPHFRSR